MAATTEVTPQTTLPAGRWAPDPVHSSISFRVRNMGIVTVAGYFADFEGARQRRHPRGRPRRGHRRGPEHRHAVREARPAPARRRLLRRRAAPEIRFASTSIEPDGDGLKVVGDLTIKGVARSVELHAVPQAPEPIEDPWGGTRIGLEVTGEIDRRDYDLNWNIRTPPGPAGQPQGQARPAPRPRPRDALAQTRPGAPT